MHAELCGPLGADFYCGSSGTPERFAWLQKPEAQMVQPSPNFVFANSTVSGQDIAAIWVAFFSRYSCQRYRR